MDPLLPAVLETRLLKDAVQGTGGEVVIARPGDGHEAWLAGMLELLVATAGLVRADRPRPCGVGLQGRGHEGHRDPEHKAYSHRRHSVIARA